MSNIFKTIRGNIIFFFTSTLFLIIILQIGFNVFLSEKMYIAGRRAELVKIYNNLSYNFDSDADSIYQKVAKYEDVMNLRVFVFDSSGKIIYETMSNQVSELLVNPFSINNNGQVISNFSSTPQANVVKSYRNNTQTLAVRGSINDGPLQKVYIILETPLATITDATKTLSKYSLTINLIAMWLGATIIYYFAFRLSKPIEMISDVTKSVAKLDFSKKAPTDNSSLEVEQLAENINFMSDQLEKMIYDLKIANIELKKDNDHRKHIDDMRREFISNVSHELKTPLSLLQGYSEILKSDINGIDKDFYFDVIIDETNHMNDLVKRLLNVSSLENGLTKLNYEPFNLSELIRWIVNKNELLIREKKLEVDINILENAQVFADKLLIEQAFTNYLSNAISYANKKIVVKIEKKDKYFTLSIFNDGENISEDNLEKVWDSFYREDKSRTRSKDKNFGLGLYIVKTVITAHNGNYFAYNCDEGVCFGFELPENEIKFLE